jgi:hypothetical protein
MSAHLLEDPFLDLDAPVSRTRRNLPHWSQVGKLYFVTWRLADSLPNEARMLVEADRKAWLKKHGDRPVSELGHRLKREWYRLFHHRVQRWLDAGHGACVLRDTGACGIVAGALRHFHGVRYHLGSFTIAGNHVHALVAPNEGVELSAVMHSWKSFTANAINRALERQGPLWMDEYFDRLLRNELHLERVEAYIAGHARQGAYVEIRPC